MKDYVLTLLVAAAVTYLLTPLVRRGAIRVGALKQPRERDIHTAPVPTMGGVAMYVGLAAGLLVAAQLPQLRQNAFGGTGMVPGLLLAGGLLVAIGMVDDRWGLSAITKLAGQVAAGAILVATGTQLNWLPLPGGATFATTPDQSTLLTILIVVATINAVNFIDGLDGLAAGIVAIAAASFLIYYYSMTKVVQMSALAAPALASAILTGVCLGFLPHNFHPARVFMGDTGAMLLGLVLAYAPISSIASLDPAAALLSSRVNRYPEILPLLLPATLLVIPYADLLLAVIRRMRRGLSPFAADQEHLHHRLLQIGHSQRASVLVMYLWALLFSGSIVWFSLERTQRPRLANHHGQPVVVFVVITAAAVVALLLMAMPRWRNRDRVVRLKSVALPAEAGRLATSQSDLAPVASPQPLPAPVVARPAPAGPAVARPAPADSGVVRSAPAPAEQAEQREPWSAPEQAELTEPWSAREETERWSAREQAEPWSAREQAERWSAAEEAERWSAREEAEPWSAREEAEPWSEALPPAGRSVIGMVPPAVMTEPLAVTGGLEVDEPGTADQVVWPTHAAQPRATAGRHEQSESLPRRVPYGHPVGGRPASRPRWVHPDPTARPAGIFSGQADAAALKSMSGPLTPTAGASDTAPLPVLETRRLPEE